MAGLPEFPGAFGALVAGATTVKIHVTRNLSAETLVVGALVAGAHAAEALVLGTLATETFAARALTATTLAVGTVAN